MPCGLKDNLCFKILPSVILPKTNSNFMIIFEFDQIEFGLMFMSTLTSKCFTCNNKYEFENGSCLGLFCPPLRKSMFIIKKIYNQNIYHNITTPFTHNPQTSKWQKKKINQKTYKCLIFVKLVHKTKNLNWLEWLELINV